MDTRALWLALGLIMSAAGCVTGDDVTSVEDDDDETATTPQEQQVKEEEQAAKQSAAPVAKKDGGSAGASTAAKASARPQVTGTDKRPKLPAPPKLKGPAKTAAKPGKTAVRIEPSAGKAARLVTVGVLNIRSRPSTTSSVVGKLMKGTVLPVTIKGQWAQLGDNQWVLAKYLASVTP
jgi:hypothetical protein